MTAPHRLPQPVPSERSLAECEQLLLDHLSYCLATLERLGRRAHLGPEDVEDLQSFCLLKLVANNYAIFRAFSGGCRFTSFLDSVLRNLLRDFRNSLWGKWRPSARAKQLGALAVEYERLTHRDGFGHLEAARILLGRRSGCMEAQEVERLPALLPLRLVRQHEPLGEIPDPAATDSFMALDLASCRGQLDDARRRLSAAIRQLPASDRTMLALHFVNGLSLAEIARQFRLNQRSLYTQRERCLRELRKSFKGSDLTWVEMAPLLASAADELELGRLLEA